MKAILLMGPGHGHVYDVDKWAQMITWGEEIETLWEPTDVSPKPRKLHTYKLEELVYGITGESHKVYFHAPNCRCRHM